MGMFSFLTGGVVDTIGDVAKEWIQTDMESAEAKSIFVKTLDPNGKMRKQISKDVTLMYKVYLFTSLVLLIAQFFGLGEVGNIKDVTSKLVELFLPITGMFSAIVGASFGVNAYNIKQGM